MIETAAVVPQPPLLVPELTGRASGETRELRDACRDVAVRLAATARRWLVVGSAPTASRHVPPACGTFAGFGADVRVALAGPDAPGADASVEPDRELPLPVLVAGWLRGQAGRAGDAVAIDAHVLSAGTDVEDGRRAGAELAATDLAATNEPTALLVVGDGDVPGGGVADALGQGDARALLAAGRVPWWVLAGALPTPSSARLLHTSAPYGVGYHVALWAR